MLAGIRYLNLQDLINFPNPFAPRFQLNNLNPVHPAELEKYGSMFDAIKAKEQLLHFPYHSFDYVLRFFYEASIDPKVEEIQVTQYRVATNSAVVNALISAAQNGKKVTVFVEVKARFDEENNLNMARLMEKAGVRIIYSIPGLKVHAKMALIIRSANGQRKRSFAYLSTGNFNERTARTYADHGFFTCKNEILTDLENLFLYLKNQAVIPSFQKLLVTQFNFKQELIQRIDNEIEIAQNGGDGYILLKMNGIQNKSLINKLYDASISGVKIDLIIRSICCLIPNQPFSANIRLVRIVDTLLEHARIWVFGKNKQEMYLTSADWLNRNLNRRIELAFPIEDNDLRQEIIDILNLQLNDNVKARTINENLENIKPFSESKTPVRAQWDTFEMIAKKDHV
jgi:polyphosphate kinase